MSKFTLARLFWVLWVFFALGTCGQALAENLQPTTKAKETQRFLSLADIHFDPFISCKDTPCPLVLKLREAPVDQWSELLTRYDSSIIEYGKDSNYALLASSLAAAKKQATAAKVQFVLVLGDFLGHSYDKKYRKYSGDTTSAGYIAFVKKTMIFLGKQMNQAFPQADIYWVVGNNDSYGEDYTVQPGGLFFKDLSELDASLVKNINNRRQLLREFPKGGYYAVNAPSQPGIRLIFLNSVLFSRKAKGSALDQAAQEQLDWLHKELSLVSQKNQKALIALHIPTGVDVYTSLFLPFTLIEFWKAPYSQRFLSEVQQASAHIMGVFTAHIHADAFQILKDPQHKAVPFTGTPSISPIFGNNPGFKIYSYSVPTLNLVDFVTYYYSLNNHNEWEKEYDFDEVYRLNHSDGELINGMLQLQPRGELAKRYKTYYAVNSKSRLIIIYDKWFPYFWCGTRGLTAADYRYCLASSEK